MPLTGSLFDNFDDNSLDPALWNSGVFAGGSIQNTNGQIRFYSALTGADSSLYNNAGPYDLRNSYIQVEVVNAGNQSLASLQTKFCRFESVAVGTAYAGYFFSVLGGTLSALVETEGGFGFNAPTTYNSTTHRWLRLSERSGSIYFQYSSNPTGPWSTLYSTTSHSTIGTSSFVENSIEAGAEASTTVVIIDNFNIISGAASTTKPTITFRVNLSSATKAKSAIASPAKSLISVIANNVTASKGLAVDNKTASTTKALVSVITNTTTASKGVNKTASPTKSTVTVQVNTTTASKIVSKTAQLTTAYVTVRTGALTASSGVTPETKTASTTNQLISVVAGTPSVSKTVIKTATTTTTYISVKTNSVTCTAVKIKTASTTKTFIRFVVNSTSGQIPSGVSGIDLTALGKSRINRVINSEELKVIR